MNINRRQAFEILSYIRISVYNNNLHNVKRDDKGCEVFTYRFIRHSMVAGRVCEKIAEYIGGLDTERAYILGLLHDIGRFQVLNFHGLNGYKVAKNFGLNQLASVAITHTLANLTGFYYDFFEMQRRTLPQNTAIYDADEAECREIVKTLAVDDYDFIVAMADSLAIGVNLKADTFEDRFADIYERYYKGGDEEKSKLFSRLKNSKLEIKNYLEGKMNGKTIDDVVNTLENEDDSKYNILVDTSYKQDLGKNFDDIFPNMFYKKVEEILNEKR